MKVLKNFISHALSYHEVHPSKLVKSRVLKKKRRGDPRSRLHSKRKEVAKANPQFCAMNPDAHDREAVWEEGLQGNNTCCPD